MQNFKIKLEIKHAFFRLKISSKKPIGNSAASARPLDLYHLFLTFSANPSKFSNTTTSPESRTALPLKYPNT